MGSPGGAIYLGKVCKQIADDLKRITSNLGMVKMSTAEASVRDVPLLVKALSLSDAVVRDEARQALVKLSGEDFGEKPSGWEKWWEAYHARLVHQEAGEKAVEGLFNCLRQSVMTGRWGTVRETLSGELRMRMPARKFVSDLTEAKRELRMAYRDARITDLRLAESEGTVTVDWGHYGFGMAELPLVREAGQWRFARLPWTDHVEARTAGALPVEYHSPGRRPKPHRTSAVKRCGTFCLCVFLVMGLFALMATPFFPLAYLTLLLLGPIAYGAACLWDKVAAGPAAAGMKRRMARRAHHARAR